MDWLGKVFRFGTDRGELAMYENLVRQLNLGCLHCPYEHKECSQNAYCEVMINASNAIETLLSENIELKRSIAFLNKNTLGKLRAELDRLKCERDQAVEDLDTLRKRSRWKCEACYYNDHYDRDICTGCEYNNYNNWQWRGVQEENNETD